MQHSNNVVHLLQQNVIHFFRAVENLFSLEKIQYLKFLKNVTEMQLSKSVQCLALQKVISILCVNLQNYNIG